MVKIFFTSENLSQINCGAPKKFWTRFMSPVMHPRIVVLNSDWLHIKCVYALFKLGIFRLFDCPEKSRKLGVGNVLFVWKVSECSFLQVCIQFFWLLLCPKYSLFLLDLCTRTNIKSFTIFSDKLYIFLHGFMKNRLESGQRGHVEYS